jgi:hypothetical protein
MEFEKIMLYRTSKIPKFCMRLDWGTMNNSLKNKNSLSLKFKPYNISCLVETRRDSIQTFEIHSELLFRYCSCYSDTRGVTWAVALVFFGIMSL